MSEPQKERQKTSRASVIAVAIPALVVALLSGSKVLAGNASTWMTVSFVLALLALAVAAVSIGRGSKER